MKKTIVINTFFNGFTGYGIKIQEIVRGLVKRDYQVKCRQLFVHEEFGCPIPDDIKATFVGGEQPEPWELVLYPPRHKSEFPDNSTKKQILYTMWETTKLPQQFVKNCNKYIALITPTIWNKKVFSSCGVKVPIHVSPLGIDMEIFKPNLRRFPPECVFVTAGRVAHGYSRKGIDSAMEIFRRAFPREADVKLRVKCSPDCVTAPNFDSRISVVKAMLTPTSMAEFYQDSTAYLDTTLAEGFGLHQLEANACGKLVVGADFSGKPIFNGKDLNIRVDFKTVRCNVKDPYQCLGQWAQLDEADTVKKMRYVYENQDKVWLDGQVNRKSVENLSIDGMVDSLVDTLAKIGVI